MESGPVLSALGPTREVPPFRVIYQEYFDFVWAGVRSMGVGAEAIDDVVQEIFIVIHARLHTLEDPAALRSWIYGVIRRTVLAQLRAQRARGVSPLNASDEGEHPSLMPTPADLAEHTDQVKLLWRLLGELDAPKREAFVLAELEEMTMPEIALALELPLGTVYSRVRAARQAFDAALERHNLRGKRGGTS